MFDSIQTLLKQWHSKYDSRAKLQHTYVLLAVGLLLAAGVVGLVNHTMGQNVLMVAIISAGAFLTNAVVWSLLQSAVLSRLTVRRKGTTTKK
jgi:tellurite resistance protein TehA-like permease